MNGYFKRVAALTPTRLWINNITLRQARLGLAAGAIGTTQNPAHLAKVLVSEDRAWLMGLADEILGQEADDTRALSALQRQAIAGLCKEFGSLYADSGGRLGYVSIQADPFHEDAGTILENAEKSLSLAKNFIIKVPVTQDGLSAIDRLVQNRVAVLATEVMSLDQVRDIVETYEQAAGGITSPAPLIIAHINGIFDEYLAEVVAKEGVFIHRDALAQASLILGRKISAWLRCHGNPNISYMAGGARGLHHFTNWVGVEGAVTINWQGTADKLLELDSPVLDVFRAPNLQFAVDELTAKLTDFQKAWTPGSLTPVEYEGFGPVTKFRKQFEAGWTNALEMLKLRRMELS